MNQQQSAFLTAFWTGLASPVALFSTPPVYVPAVSNCTVGSSFASVGVSLSLLVSHGGRTLGAIPTGTEQSVASTGA
jgi:hypothetical protein